MQLDKALVEFQTRNFIVTNRRSHASTFINNHLIKHTSIKISVSAESGSQVAAHLTQRRVTSGHRLTQSGEHETPDFGVMSSRPTLNVELTFIYK